MTAFAYYNPVKIEFGTGLLDELHRFVGSRKVLLVTSRGFRTRGVIDRLLAQPMAVVAIVDSIAPNPTFDHLRGLYRFPADKDVELIVALGGGSVLDSAKVLSVSNETRDFAFVESLIRNQSRDQCRCLPIIAIPTTSGTGSEVTPWGTVWDMGERKKYSIHLPGLWPERCVCDPSLAVSVSKEITIQTALDALSHSLESIWNKNANPISTRHAIGAVRLILETLPKLVADLGNLELRRDMMLAALSAGLAFSNTQTALAHAMSYYITAHKGIPHGIACSFTLPDLIDAVIGKDVAIDNALREIFGELSSRKLRKLFDDLHISTKFHDYGIQDVELSSLKSSLVNNQRAENSLVDPAFFFANLSYKL